MKINYSNYVKVPLRIFPWLPLLDFLFIAMLFFLFLSAFVVPAGMSIQMPAAELQLKPRLPITRVVTVGETDGNELLLFEGRVLNLETFDRVLPQTTPDPASTTLLLRLDAGVTMTTLLRIGEIAQRHGIAEVRIAADPKAAEFPHSGSVRTIPQGSPSNRR